MTQYRLISYTTFVAPGYLAFIIRSYLWGILVGNLLVIDLYQPCAVISIFTSTTAKFNLVLSVMCRIFNFYLIYNK